MPETRTTAKLILTRPKALLSEQLRKSIIDNKDLDWFYINIPEPPPLNTGGLSKVVEQLNGSDKRWWTKEEVTRHLDMMKELHQERVGKFANGNNVVYRTFFRRRRAGVQRAEVREDDLAGCLRTVVGGS
jgi:DNA (cytosine-5)-methyltransferase 1